MAEGYLFLEIILDNIVAWLKTSSFQMADLMASETMSEYLQQKRALNDLQNRVAEQEFQILEAEKLRKKLHNTILVLVIYTILAHDYEG